MISTATHLQIIPAIPLYDVKYFSVLVSQFNFFNICFEMKAKLKLNIIFFYVKNRERRREEKKENFIEK